MTEHTGPTTPVPPPCPDRPPAAELLAEVYGELRRVAGAMLGRLKPGQTLAPTALVHEAYLRLVRNDDAGWEGRRHFFGAAAQAMREILIEQARSKGRLKRGGGGRRVELDDALAAVQPPTEDVIAVDEAIAQLRAEDADLAELVNLRFYAGLSLEQAAAVLGRSVSTLTREWRFARAWLARKLGEVGDWAGTG